MTVPRSLRRWFVFHFVADLIFAVPLLLWPSPKKQLRSQTGLPKPQASRTSSKATLPASVGGPGPDQPLVQQGPSKTKIQLQAQSSPDRTLFDPRGQQPDERISAELPSQTETRVPQALEQPAATVGPDATLILDRLPDHNQPGQTQIQFVLPPQHNSPDRTMLDPRGQQTVVLKPDETVIDPRGEETLIISPKDKPPTKT